MAFAPIINNVGLLLPEDNAQDPDPGYFPLYENPLAGALKVENDILELETQKKDKQAKADSAATAIEEVDESENIR